MVIGLMLRLNSWNTEIPSGDRVINQKLVLARVLWITSLIVFVQFMLVLGSLF